MSVLSKPKIKLLLIINSIPEILRQEAEKHKEFIEDLNREQLLDGKKADGSNMPFYVKGSKQPSAPGRITLKDKGDFHKGIRAIFSNNGIDVDDIDEKTDLLVKKYGNVLGIENKESINKLIGVMKPGIIEQIIKILHE